MVVFISGFSQTSKRVNGVMAAFHEGAARRREAGIEGVRFEYRTWRTDWECFAAYCRFLLGNGGGKHVSIVGYSWGGGWGARVLANQLRFQGIAVPRMFLADAVYRSSILPKWLPANPLSLMSRSKIKLPSNVGHVTWMRQKQSRVRGHDVVALVPGKTRIDPAIVVRVGHSQIYETPEFERMAKDLVNDGFSWV